MKTRRLIFFSGKGFTLLEILLGTIAAAFILAAIYGIFVRALKMRDSATDRIRESRLRIRAANIIRDDLRNALVSGGVLASTLNGNVSGPQSNFPGYLEFTATTGKDSDDEMYGDVQQIQYYITTDSNNVSNRNGGVLVRDVTRDLLAPTPAIEHQTQILSGVKSLEVTFYDGQTWQNSWQLSGTATSSSMLTSGTASTSGSNSLPQAIRVLIDQAPASEKSITPPPLEILMPWTAQPWTSGT